MGEAKEGGFTGSKDPYNNNNNNNSTNRATQRRGGGGGKIPLVLETVIMPIIIFDVML